jgi:enoyl-[acyl-carrier-protein] reductase (NADH)
VRVNGIWTAGVAETLTDKAVAEVAGEGAPGAAAVLEMIAGMSVLRRTPVLADVVGAATFLASDAAAGLTGTMLNVTAGLVLR